MRFFSGLLSNDVYDYRAYFSYATLSVIPFDVFLLICGFISLLSN